MDSQSIQIHQTSILNLENSITFPQMDMIKIEKFCLIKNYPQFEGKRVNIMAKVISKSISGNEIISNVSISSFIIGKDFEQSANILLNSNDLCTIYLQGPNVEIQVQYIIFEE